MRRFTRQRTAWRPRLAAIGIVALVAIGQIAAPDSAAASKRRGILEQVGDEVADIAEKAIPAVVSIRSTVNPEARGSHHDEMLKELEQRFGPDALRRFEDFFGPRGPGQNSLDPPPRLGVGSGIIIDSDGIIVTNSHVVSGADKLDVSLVDGRTLKAEIIGADPDSDVAVLRVDAKGLPTLELGDSDTVRVGHFVVAIGSPMGLKHTVTLGIVSAMKRGMGLRVLNYESFIQTDSAINVGNSGGPLLDASGKVVGISTAIVSTSGGSQGLAMAIPMNAAKRIIRQLREKGSVSRGYLGLLGKDLRLGSPEAEHLNITGETGVVVEWVAPEMPAERAGLRPYDAIVRLDDKKIDDYADFRYRIGDRPPGEDVNLTVIRDGQEIGIVVTLAERTEENLRGPQPEPEKPEPTPQPEKPKKLGVLGVTVKILDPEKAKELGLDEDQKGLLVAKVKRTSPAWLEGLRPGVVIEQVNRRPVADLEEAAEALEAGKDRSTVLLLVRAKAGTRLLFVPKE